MLNLDSKHFFPYIKFFLPMSNEHGNLQNLSLAL